jgi:hypothetical protein
MPPIRSNRGGGGGQQATWHWHAGVVHATTVQQARGPPSQAGSLWPPIWSPGTAAAPS